MRTGAFLAACLILGWASQGEAAGIFNNGDLVQIDYRFPGQGSIYNAPTNLVVGPGVEISPYPSPDNIFAVDLSPDTITFDYLTATSWTGSAFNGPHFFDYTNTLADIVGITIDPATNLVGFGPGNVTFDANNIFINWQGLGFNANTVVILRVQTPEPASLLAWGLITGVGLAGYRLRRRKVTA